MKRELVQIELSLKFLDSSIKRAVQFLFEDMLSILIGASWDKREVGIKTKRKSSERIKKGLKC